MRKLLSCVLCAVLTISAAASASAEEVNKTAGGDSYRDEFIGALIKEDNSWTENYAAMLKSDIQFIDLNFDGKKEFVVQYYAMDDLHKSDIYSLDNGVVRKVEYENSDIAVQTEGLKGYYDSAAKDYMMIGSYVTKTGYIETKYCDNFVLLYDPDNYSLKTDVHSGYEISGETNAESNKTTYYSVDKNVISEEEYNSINSAVVSGYSDINLKFEKEDLRAYRALSNSEKKEKLEWLYGSSAYDDTEKSESEPKPIPDTDKESDNGKDNNNNSNNSNNSNNNSSIKSPQTGVESSFKGVLAVILAGGAVAFFAAKKSKEDI